ncbi:MAG: CBS domain-containing protein [Proteobacteria bacterium]|nr:CBS domain-containing protein [Pseudomonadota bacterium]
MGSVVRQCMSVNPAYVDIRARVREVMRAMQRKDIRHILVLEAGNLRGIVSDRDIRGYLLHLDERIDFPQAARARLDAPVTELMQADVLSVEPETELVDAIELMLSQNIGALPVVDAHSQRVVGILSYVDVMRASVPYFTEFAQHVPSGSA